MGEPEPVTIQDQHMEEGEVLEEVTDAMKEGSEEKSKDTTYADAAAKLPNQSGTSKRSGPSCFEVLHVQSGSTMRSELLEDDWNKIWAMLHEIWMEKLMSDDWDFSIKVEWSAYLKGSGLIACFNEATVIFLRNLIADIKLDGKVFRAWKRKEFGFPRLVTLFLPPSTQVIKSSEEKTLLLWRKQNGLLAGELANPRFKRMEKPVGCRLVTFGVNNELLERVRNLGGVAYLGLSKIKVHISKTEDEKAAIKAEAKQNKV